MELGVAIALLVGLSFVGILGYKAFVKYNETEHIKSTHHHNIQQGNLIYENKIKDLENSNRNYVYKIRKLRENYELDYDDVELDENTEDDFKLSELAQSIYPKLPNSLAKLIDKEEFQNAVVKTVEKKPDILNTFIDKFVGKGSDQERSSLNTTPTLKETYL